MSDSNPIEIFDAWFKEASNCAEIADVTAVNLATATREGKPSNRMVLLKDYDEAGFVFYTNLQSRKGGELAENPHVALCFYWAPLGRQVRVEGQVQAVSDAEADEYFNSRPLKSRVGAVISKQSSPLNDYAALLKEAAALVLKAGAAGKIERPNHWSGFRVIPHSIEFWENGDSRLHSRRIYQMQEDGRWNKGLLYP